jgi:hypothetical protein
MNAVAWMSNAEVNFEISLRLKSNLSNQDVSLAEKISRQYGRAEIVPEDQLPHSFYAVYERVKLDKLPPIFKSLGYWFVRQDCAEIFKQFDLGQGGFHPIKLFNFDRTLASDSCSILLFGGQKRAFLPEVNEMYVHGGRTESDERWYPNDSSKLIDDQIILSPLALQGPDFWFDPLFPAHAFFSDRLAQALKAADMDKDLWLKRCRIEGGV